MNWILLALLAAFFTGIVPVFSKYLMKKFRSLPFLFLFSLFVTIGSLCFYPNIIFIVDYYLYILFATKALLVGLGWYIMTKTYRDYELSVVSPLTNLSPLILMGLSYFFLSERLNTTQISGILVIIFCGYLIEVGSFKNMFKHIDDYHPKLLWYVFIASVLGSFAAIIDKYVLQTVSTNTLLFYFFLFITIMYGIAIIIKKEVKEIKKTSKKQKWGTISIPNIISNDIW